MTSRTIPPGWVQLADGSYSPPSAIAKGIVRGKTTQAAELEGQLQEQIKDYCRKKGWKAVYSRMDVPATVPIGTPDFVIAMDGGRVIWVEAKARKEKPSDEQTNWMAALRVLGHRVGVVRNMEEFIELTK